MQFLYSVINGSRMTHSYTSPRLFVKSIKGRTVDKELFLRLVFLIVPSIYLLKLSFLSTLTPCTIFNIYIAIFTSGK